MILFTFRFCTVVCAAGMLVAHVPAEAFSIRPNCDLRTLKLSVPQRVQLQLLRQHYKAESDRIVREIRNNRCGIELSGSKKACLTQRTRVVWRMNAMLMKWRKRWKNCAFITICIKS